MSSGVRLRDSTIHLVGSVHSTTESLMRVKKISPSHVFVEATRDLIGLVRSRGPYSSNLRDLPSIIRYTEEGRIPIHGIDTSSSELAGKVFDGLSRLDRARLWRYILAHRLLSPLAFRAFDQIIHDKVSTLDAFVARWALSPSLISEVRSRIVSGLSEEDIVKFIESRQNISSFLCSSDYDPEIYVHLCKLTGIDKRLQSVIIDYRNDYMCHQIRRILRTIPPESVCAVVVGQNHISGMLDNLQRGMDHNPPSLEGVKPNSSFMDQFLLAQLLNS